MFLGMIVAELAKMARILYFFNHPWRSTELCLCSS